MLIGTAVHAGIAALMAEDGTQDAAYGALRNPSPLAHARTSAFDQAGEDARARLAAFAEVRAQFGTATAIENVSRRAHGRRRRSASGKLDAVLERDGRKTIVDFKTSSTVKEADPKFALQLAFTTTSFGRTARRRTVCPSSGAHRRCGRVPIPLGASASV